jgi:hypothetical protein
VALLYSAEACTMASLVLSFLASSRAVRPSYNHHLLFKIDTTVIMKYKASNNSPGLAAPHWLPERSEVDTPLPGPTCSPT